MPNKLYARFVDKGAKAPKFNKAKAAPKKKKKAK